MFYCSFTSLVHFWPPPIFDSDYAYGFPRSLGVSGFPTPSSSLIVP